VRLRLLGEGTQPKPSLSGVFVRRTRRGEDAYHSVKKTPQRLLSGLVGLSYTKDCLMWHGHRLLLRAGGPLLAAVEPDSEWPGMWRVRLPDGDLSDMANRTRAKDAAQSFALATLNSAEGRQHDTRARREASLFIATADRLRFQGSYNFCGSDETHLAG
jgi:hypothetical protein